jgi:excisionase family DNA binding protein
MPEGNFGRMERSTTKNRDSMAEQLLTLEQVAKYLNVDKFTVYRLLNDKELPAFKVGNQWRFKRKLLENWLMKNSNVKRKDVSPDH